MHFLIDASLPRLCRSVLHQAGHEATDVRDIGLTTAADPVIAAYAVQHQFCILTGDYDFADIRQFPPREHAGIVLLSLPKEGATVDVVCDILRKFLSDMPSDLHGRLFVTRNGRIRIRY